jgi:hypothetical protein
MVYEQLLLRYCDRHTALTVHYSSLQNPKKRTVLGGFPRTAGTTCLYFMESFGTQLRREVVEELYDSVVFSIQSLSNVRSFLHCDIFSVGRTPMQCARRFSVTLWAGDDWHPSSYSNAATYRNAFLGAPLHPAVHIHRIVEGDDNVAREYEKALVPLIYAAKANDINVIVTQNGLYRFNFETRLILRYRAFSLPSLFFSPEPIDTSMRLIGWHSYHTKL